MDVHFPHGDKTRGKIRLFFRVGLADDAFIAFAGGPGFVRINSRNEYETVFYFFIDFAQTADIVADRVFVVGGTGADNDKEFIAFSGDDVADFKVPLFFQFGEMLGNRKPGPDIFRCRKFADKLKRDRKSVV